MANPKKNAKSSKTAHVLNLLAPGGESEAIRPPAVSQAEPPAPEAAGTAEGAPSPESVSPPAEGAVSAVRPLAPPILEVARSNDEQVSLQIKDVPAVERVIRMNEMRDYLQSEISAQLNRHRNSDSQTIDMQKLFQTAIKNTFEVYEVEV